MARGRKRPLLEESTFRDYEAHLRLRLLPAFGRRKVRQITRAHVEAYLATLDRSGTLSRKTFFESVMSATRLTCMIMLILAGAAYTTAAMAYTGIPAALAEWVKGQDLTPGMLALYLSIMYIILGCLIDGISMIVLTAVVVLPMVQQAGLDLIWFGVYLVIHVEMAQVTPPVGFNLFVLQNMSGRDTLTVAKAAFPFFVLLLAAVFIITEFPEIVLLLPHMAFPPS